MMMTGIDSIDEALFEITDGYDLDTLVRVSTIVDILLDVRCLLEDSQIAHNAITAD